MKKMLVVLLSLAVAGGVFAVDLPDGLSVTGEVKTGLRIDAYDGDTAGYGYNNDAGENFRARVNVDLVGERGGVKTRFQVLNTDAATMARAFGFVNLFNKHVVVWGGLGVEDIYGVGGVVDTDVDGGHSARLEVRPIEGLSIAWGLPFSLEGNKGDAGYVFGSSRIGAKYANDFITVIASFRLNPKMKIGATGPEQNVLDAYEADGFDFLDAVYAVKLPRLGPVGLDITGAFDTSDAGFFRIAPHVDFAALESKLAIHARADINIDTGEDNVDSSSKSMANFGNREKPSEDASAGFRVGAAYQINDIIKPYLNIGSNNLGYFKGNGLYIRPAVVFSLGPNASIELFDQIGNIGADSDIAKISNQLQIDFNWTF